MATRAEIKQAAESDLLTFIKLIAPHRVLGQCHEDIIKWWTRPDAWDHQMLLLPRDHQKSTLAAYRCAWEITRNPAVTILYISATSGLAEKQLQFIKDILASNKYRRYWPEMIHEDEGKREKWTNSEIQVDHPQRKAEGVRDSTVFAAGLTTSITGLHCNIAVLDDCVVNENAYTKEGREKVSRQYSLLASIETTGAREWIVGTRYHPRDLYGTLMEVSYEIFDKNGEVIESKPIYEVWQKEVEDIGDGSGIYLWPRMQRDPGKWFGFNQQILAQKKAKYLDKTQFYSQYYNNPNDPGEAAISPEFFQHYDRKFLKYENGKWWYNGKLLNVFAAIDFAYSLKATADYTALIVVGVDADGYIYVLDIQRDKTNKTGDYFNMILQAHMKWGFKKMRAETVGGQKVIAEYIKDEIRREGLSLSVEDYHPTRNMGSKEERIHATLKPRYENYTIWHYRGGYCEDLEQELIMYNPPNDDIKDAFESVCGILRPPLSQVRHRREKKVIYDGRFGGVR